MFAEKRSQSSIDSFLRRRRRRSLTAQAQKINLLILYQDLFLFYFEVAVCISFPMKKKSSIGFRNQERFNFLKCDWQKNYRKTIAGSDKRFPFPIPLPSPSPPKCRAAKQLGPLLASGSKKANCRTTTLLIQFRGKRSREGFKSSEATARNGGRERLLLSNFPTKGRKEAVRKKPAINPSSLFSFLNLQVSAMKTSFSHVFPPTKQKGGEFRNNLHRRTAISNSSFCMAGFLE